MAKLFFTEGRCKLVGQMCMNVFQYLVIAAIASELLKLQLIHRLTIGVAAVMFGIAGVLIWPRGG